MPRSLRPGEVKILKALYNDKKKSFTELESQTHLSTPILSQYLKDFQKGQPLVERDIDSRTYYITEDGKKAHDTQQILDTVSSLRSLEIKESGNVTVCLLGDRTPPDTTNIQSQGMPGLITFPDEKRDLITSMIYGGISHAYNLFISSIYATLFEQIRGINPRAKKQIDEIVSVLKRKDVGAEQIAETKKQFLKAIPRGRAMIIFSFDSETFSQDILNLMESKHGRFLLAKMLTGEASKEWKEVSGELILDSEKGTPQTKESSN